MTKNFLPWRSIHARITLTTLGLFLVSLWSLSYITSQILRKDLQRLLSEQQFATVSMVATRLNDELNTRFRSLQKYAELSSEAMLKGASSMQTELDHHPLLKELFNNGLFVCAPDGTTIANTLSSENLCREHVNVAAVTAALKEGKSTIGQLVVNQDKRDAAFAMATPIYDANRKIIGALAGMIRLSTPSFLDKFTEKPYGMTGSYLIAEPKQRLIISATEKKRHMEILPPAGVNPALDRFLLGYEGSQIMRNPLGVEILASDIGIQKTGWVLAAILPTEEAFAPIVRIQRHMMIGTILLTLLSGLLSWWVLRRQLAPLIETAKILDDIANNRQERQTLPIVREDEIGRLVGAFNHLLDGLNQREVALQKSEIFIRAIINSVPAKIAVLDHEGVITMLNQSWIRFNEENTLVAGICTSKAGIGVNYLDVCRTNANLSMKDDALRALNGIQAVLNGYLPDFTMEYRYESPSRQLWFNLVVTPLDHDQRGVVVSHTDITGRRQVEESLRLFRASMQGASEAIIWVTADARIADVNTAASQLLGYSAQELLQMQISDISQVQPLNREDWTEYFNRLRQQGSMKFESLLRAKDGRLIPVEVMANYVRHSGEEFSCAFVRDITARKQSESALEAAKAEAEKANNAKSRFLAAASHDLRQPLSALSLYVNLLEHHVSPDSGDIVSSIQHCVVSLSELLTDLLDISKLDAGVVTPKPSDFFLDDLLTSLASVYAVESATKNLQLRVRPSGIAVHSDQRLLHRVIGNLISNAIRYTEKGGVLIACRRYEGKLWLEVWDTGMGIPEGKTKIIFEEFRQLGDEARNRGSGLGLSIVSKMASLLNLQIRVRSRLGTGSIFSLELPPAINHQNDSVEDARITASDQASLANENEQFQHAPPTTSQFSEPASIQRHDKPSGINTLKIGIIDDNPQVLQALAFALENSGYQVIAATNCKQLMERLRTDAPNLILSDYRLAAGENGFEVIAAARAKFGADLPAIIMTGDTDPSMIRSMGGHGITILYKPVQFDTLQAVVNDAIQQGNR